MDIRTVSKDDVNFRIYSKVITGVYKGHLDKKELEKLLREKITKKMHEKQPELRK